MSDLVLAGLAVGLGIFCVGLTMLACFTLG